MSVEDLTSHVRRILLTDWDPTDASRSEHARGAYDAFIDPLIALVRSGGGEESVMEHLHRIEHQILCFPSLGRERLRRVARKIIASAGGEPR